MDTNKRKQDQTDRFTADKLLFVQRNWDSWPTSRIGEMLYANTGGYHSLSDSQNGSPIHVQRSACFELKGPEFDELKKLRDDKKLNYLRFHIGANSSAERQSFIDQDPIFTLILEAVLKKSKTKGQAENPFYPLTWRPQPLYANTKDLAGAEAIATQTADLFCRSFCQLKTSELGEIFEAAIGTGVYRLNNFSFRSEASGNSKQPQKNSVEKQIRRKLKKADKLCISFGESAPFPGHPYRFRPILVLEQDKKGSNADPDYPANFEFSIHCPPIC